MKVQIETHDYKSKGVRVFERLSLQIVGAESESHLDRFLELLELHWKQRLGQPLDSAGTDHSRGSEDKVGG